MIMNGFTLVDTFNDFKKYWRKVAGKSLDEKIELYGKENTCQSTLNF